MSASGREKIDRKKRDIDRKKGDGVIKEWQGIERKSRERRNILLTIEFL